MILSVIISNRNDCSMLVVTIRSLIEELRPIKGNYEIVIADNSDLPIYEKVKSFIPAGYIRDKTVKLLRQDFPCLFSARELAIANSSGEYIACIDSHCLSGRDSFMDLLKFLYNSRDNKQIAFAHAPISWAHHHESTARHDRDMSTHELGDWGIVYNTNSIMTWKGMPWMCRREVWEAIGGYGVLARNKMSWGGGDLLIGVKPLLLGYQNWAVATSPIVHIGPFPKIEGEGVRNGDERYRLYAVSGKGPATFGFLVVCYILGGVEMMERNKKAIQDKFGVYFNVEQYWQRAIETGRTDRKWLLERQVISFSDYCRQIYPQMKAV